MKFSLKILDLRLNGVMPYLLSNIGINCRVIDGMIGISERIIFFLAPRPDEEFFLYPFRDAPCDFLLNPLKMFLTYACTELLK